MRRVDFRSAGMDLARVTTAASGFRSISASWALGSMDERLVALHVEDPVELFPLPFQRHDSFMTADRAVGAICRGHDRLPPKHRTTSAMRASSVATTTLA